MLVLSLCFSSAVLASPEVKNSITNADDTIKTFTIDEVIVTSSQKETNDFRTLPVAVSLLSPRQVSYRQIEGIKDISTFVPNLYMPDYGSKLTSAVYIRGIGARSSGQTMGLYVDNIPYMDKASYDFELMDIQRIEILRGPQGTLYGRNAMGGIVNIYTLSPFTYQGTRATVSAGSYGQYNVRASKYMLFGDKVGLSLGGYYNSADGFFTNSYTGKKADDQKNAGGQLKFDVRFNPNFSLAYSARFDYTHQGAFPYGQYDATTDKTADVSINDPSSYHRRLLTNHLQLVYKTDKWSLTSNTGYQFLQDHMQMDQDFTSASIFTLNQKQKEHSVNEEIAMKSLTQGNYQWSVGLYGFYDGMKITAPVDFKEDGIKTVLQPVFDKLKVAYPKMPQLVLTDNEIIIPGNFKKPTYGFAAFHQSTYNNFLTKGLSITAGVRLDYEKQTLDYNSTAKMNMGIQLFDGAPVVDLAKFASWDASVMNVHIHQDFLQLLPKFSIKYECDPSTFTYLTVTKGYKAGGYNEQMSADLMQSRMQYDMMNAFTKLIPTMKVTEPAAVKDVIAYKPEYSWNYELGFRSELIKDRLSVEATFYFMDIRDIQLTQFVNSGNGRILTNAGKAHSCGTEITLNAKLAEGLTANINYGYTHATFRDYNNGKVDYSGNYIPYAPINTFNASLQYVRPLHCWFDQFIGSAQYGGAGKIYWTEANDISQNFYGTLNMKAGVRKGDVTASVWTRNLTNTDYSAFYFESFGRQFMQKGKPFQIGVELSVAF